LCTSVAKISNPWVGSTWQTVVPGPSSSSGSWLPNWAVLQQRLVVAELDVDQPPPVGPGLRDVGVDHLLVVEHRVDLPDDVVAEAETVDHLIESRRAGADPVTRAHVAPLGTRRG